MNVSVTYKGGDWLKRGTRLKRAEDETNPYLERRARRKTASPWKSRLRNALRFKKGRSSGDVQIEGRMNAIRLGNTRSGGGGGRKGGERRQRGKQISKVAAGSAWKTSMKREIPPRGIPSGRRHVCARFPRAHYINQTNSGSPMIKPFKRGSSNRRRFIFKNELIIKSQPLLRSKKMDPGGHFPLLNRSAALSNLQRPQNCREQYLREKSIEEGWGGKKKKGVRDKGGIQEISLLK